MKDKIASKDGIVIEEQETRKPLSHPSRSLVSRSKGYGIGGGYERPYRKGVPPADNRQSETYGPVPHSGYYGAGAGAERFERGQAGFANEVGWYGAQYGERTSGRSKENS
jgi:hypothetical protein